MAEKRGNPKLSQFGLLFSLLNEFSTTYCFSPNQTGIFTQVMIFTSINTSVVAKSRKSSLTYYLQPLKISCSFCWGIYANGHSTGEGLTLFWELFTVILYTPKNSTLIGTLLLVPWKLLQRLFYCFSCSLIY